MSYKLSPHDTEQELERLREDGALRSAMTLERDGETSSPVLVRPVVGDAEESWVPELADAIGASHGVVAFSGMDMEETASMAADAAAWLGDRGRSVVLVDAAIERPVLGKPLDDDGDEGLVDAVLFGVSPEAVTRRTLSTGVRVITAGSYPLSIEEVFDGPGLPPLLGALSDENLVLLLVSPVHLFKVSALLNAAVCVAGDPADIESLARSIEEVRSIGVLVRDAGAASAPAEAAEEQSEETSEVEEPSAMEDERSDVEDATEAEAPPEVEEAASEGEDPKAGGETAPETEETPEAEQPAAEVEEAPEEPSPEPAEEPVPEPKPAPVNAPYINPAGPVDPRRHERPEPVKEPELVEQEKRTRVPIYAALVLVLAIVWWFVDGQHRFAARTEGPIETQGERVVEGTGAGGQDAVGDRSQQDDGVPAGSSVSRNPEPAETDAAGAAARQGSHEEMSGPGGRYIVMISSHYREIAATLESAELENRGVASEVVPADLGDRGVWYRVVVAGGYPSLSDARSVLDTIKSFGYEGAWIERAPDNR